MTVRRAYSVEDSRDAVERTDTCADVRFFDNTGVGVGGVLGLFTGITSSITACNFTSNNSPAGSGAALFMVTMTSANVVNSSFVGNTGRSCASVLRFSLAVIGVNVLFWMLTESPSRAASSQGALGLTSIASAVIQHNIFRNNQGNREFLDLLRFCSTAEADIGMCHLPQCQQLLLAVAARPWVAQSSSSSHARSGVPWPAMCSAGTARLEPAALVAGSMLTPQETWRS